MKYIREKWCIFIICSIFIILFTFFIYSENSDNKILNEVRLKEDNIINNKNFAIMVEKSDGSGYEEVNSFPIGLSLNQELSGCLSLNGKLINNALTYENGLVKVDVGETAYCYLYFYNDNVAPIVSVSVINNETENAKLVIISNETGTYCVNTSSTLEDLSNCIFEGTIYGNVSLTTNAVSENGTYYVHVKDGGENIGISNEAKVKVKSSSFGEDLLSNPPTGLNSTLEGGLYRFQGTSGNVDNFVCFGTSDKNTCLGNTDAYIYRIIGITEDGQIKLIKNEALNSTMKWYSSSSSNITWPNSTIHSNINRSSFLTNSTYMPSGWEDKIETTTWKYGDNANVNTTAANLYSIENAWANTTNAKIGLMYMYDYYYGFAGGNNCSSSDATCRSSWLHLQNCDSGAPYQTEWTMSRYGFYAAGNAYGAYYVVGGSSILNPRLHYDFSVRPVFYLTSEVQFEGGTGTSTDPFIIS